MKNKGFYCWLYGAIYYIVNHRVRCCCCCCCYDGYIVAVCALRCSKSHKLLPGGPNFEIVIMVTLKLTLLVARSFQVHTMSGWLPNRHLLICETITGNYWSSLFSASVHQLAQIEPCYTTPPRGKNLEEEEEEQQQQSLVIFCQNIL